jgi:hypothetical protein
MKLRHLRASLLGAVLCGAQALGIGAWAQTSLLPNGQQQFSDANGAPYTNGTVCFYSPGTLTPKTTWAAVNMTSANASPCLTLDSAGRATIFGYGNYREILSDQFSNQIWDKVTTDFASPIQNGTFNYGGTSTGSANIQAITLSPVPPAYVAGQTFWFIPGFTNTSSVTLNVNGLGNQTVDKISPSGPTALSGGEIVVGQITAVLYDGAKFLLTAPPVSNLPAPGALNNVLISNGSGSWLSGVFPGFKAQAVTSAGHTVTNADCGSLFYVSAAVSTTFTFPASSAGYNVSCDIAVVNVSTTNGLAIANVSSGQLNWTNNFLYPGLALRAFNNGSSFSLSQTPGRWPKLGANFYANISGGSNANDCITASTPCDTITHAVSRMKSVLDAQNSEPTVNAACGTYNENVNVSGQITGYNVWALVGQTPGSGAAPACTSIQGTAAGADFLIGDNDEVQIKNINVGNAHAVSGLIGYALHQYSVIDFQSGNTFSSGTLADYFECDNQGQLNIGLGAGAGNFWAFSPMVFLISIGGGCHVNWAAGDSIIALGTPAITGGVMFANGAGAAISLGNIVGFSGAVNCTGQQWTMQGFAALYLNGSTIYTCSSPGNPVAGAGVSSIAGYTSP